MAPENASKSPRGEPRSKQGAPKSREHEQDFRLLVGSVKDYAIFMLDPGGLVMTWNVGAERLKGYRADEIIGQHFSVFNTPEDKKSGKAQKQLEAALRDGRMEDESWRVRKDGSCFWANVVLTAIYDEGGALRGFAKITRDLTERRRSEADRIRLAQAEEALRLRDEFLSIASHELRTPLNALSLYLQGTKRLNDDGDRKALQTSLEKAERQVQRLAELVAGLLDVSRIAQGKLTLKRERLDLRDLVEEAVDGFGDASRSKIQVTRQAEAVIGSFDRLRLVQLVTNLVQNAVKYGRGRTIDVSVSSDGAEALVTVSDRGIGIAEADLGRIFGRFERAVPARHFGGIGLGLYICRSIVDAHGGSITVTSSVGKGSAFTVRLPLDSGGE